MSTLFAKNWFSRPSLKYCGGFRHVLGLRTARPIKNLCSRRTRKASAALHRTKEIGLYFRGVNGPPLQTTIVIVKANYTVLLPNTMLASEGNARRLLEKENRFFCVRFFSKKLSLSSGKAKTMRPHSERGNYLSKLLCSLAPRKHTAKRY